MSEQAKPLRVGLVGPIPPPNGGMALQTAQLARLLGEEGVSVELLPVNAPYRPQWLAGVPGLRAVVRLLQYLPALWRLCCRVEVIHLMANSGWSWQLFAAPALWIASWRGVPVVVNYRGGYAREYLQGSCRWVAPSLRKAHALVVPSAFLKAVFAEFGFEAEVIPNIIDTQRFCPDPVQSERDGSRPLRLVITRNLERIYGIDTAIRALAQLHRGGIAAELHIAGSGPERAALESLAKAEGIVEQVQFVGRLGAGEIEAFYRGADVMLNPSTVDNMPNSVLEALASGVPVVSTDVGGVPYLVEHERTALLVPPNAPDDIAAAVMRLVQEPSLRTALIAAGLLEVQQYTWQSVGQRWLACYHAVRTRAVRAQA